MPRTPADEITALEADSWTDVDSIRRPSAIATGQGSDERRRLKAQLHQQLIASMDVSVLGTISREELRSEVRRMAEELCQRSSNLLNRANFNTPNLIVFTPASLVSPTNIQPSGSAGAITSTSTTARQVQFALNLRW